MSAWEYRGTGEAPLWSEISGACCRYCNSKLTLFEIKDLWADAPSRLGSLHHETIQGMAEIHGDFILREMEFIAPPEEYPAELGICPQCGWWMVSKQIFLHTHKQFWFVEYGSTALLRTFDLLDIRVPTAEVRQYLAAKYQDRYNVHPRHFEKVVASVFASCGFRTQVTAYSADGGVDVVLSDDSGQTTAVQVKRYKGAIEVFQIRELLGAMILGGHTKGIFVTTSRFSAGALQAANTATANGLPIELVDGEEFLRKLRLAQVGDFAQYSKELIENVVSEITPTIGAEYHRQAL